jgi:GrpB-like predicted nucleotidyltransferase (UPF0157 family)
MGIRLVPYDSEWPRLFAALRFELEAMLPGIVADIEHIGSTAVPGLCAKPKLDVDVVTREEAAPTDAVGLLTSRGYVFHGDPWSSGMLTFTLNRQPCGVRLYACRPGNETHRRRMLFRDYLRGHPEALKEYEALKQRLAIESETDWDRYTGGKAVFVDRIVRLAETAEREAAA